MDAEGANVRRVSWQSNYCDSPDWSPGGGRMVYVSRQEGNFHLTVLDLAEGEEVRPFIRRQFRHRTRTQGRGLRCQRAR